MAKHKPPPPPLPWFEPHWTALARRLAAFAGAAAGLLALLAESSAGTAALRGALAWFSVLGLFRLGASALRSRWSQPPAETSPGVEAPRR
jgi:hypothetical protein